MSEHQQLTQSGPAARRLDVRFVIAAAAVALIAAIGGYVVGSYRSGVSTHTGYGVSGEGTISLTGDDGWVYGVPLDVNWTDANGTLHEGGRPDCLPPTDGRVGPITFAATEVSAGGVTWRPVVWVSCRG